YHTSEDLANKCDPTQLKRVCFIGAAAAYTIALAKESSAIEIAGEVTGNASDRIGKQLQRAINELESADKNTFGAIYKKTRGYIEAAVINEKATLASVAELDPGSGNLKNVLAKLTASVDGTGENALLGLDSFAEAKAKSTGLTGISLKPSKLEIQAAGIVPKPTALITENGYRGYTQIISRVSEDVRNRYPLGRGRMDTNEIGRLCNGKNSALDIKKLLDTQMNSGEADLQSVINYIYLLKEAGLVTL
ncbi:MAG: hypothetical protein JXR66_10940, partial [Bacteroidales bacterium]|nr:hypothetical protein [Bacteroidales bacterium]